MRTAEREVRGEIMKTDVFVKIVSEDHPQDELERDVDTCFSMFREFESRFSRFIPGNELAALNAAEEMVVSAELFDMLSRSIGYYRKTDRMFDPSILRTLIGEGYGESFGTPGFGKAGESSDDRIPFDSVELDRDRLLVRKSKALTIDLGGIGKGYVADRVTGFLGMKYRHFVIDAGGDMYCSGTDVERGLDAWAIDVENPVDPAKSIAMLALSDRAVATSGVNRRKWTTESREKSHLIDPMGRESVKGDILSVTVVAGSVTDADVYAKSLLIMGVEKGMVFAEREHLAALFVMKDGAVRKNDPFETFIWEKL
jgi:thiamine biosynthesis lipoprotein